MKDEYSRALALAAALALLSTAMAAPALAQPAAAEQRPAVENDLSEAEMRARLAELAEIYEPLEEAFSLVAELVGPSVVAVASVRVLEQQPSPFGLPLPFPFEEFFGRDPFRDRPDQPPQRQQGIGSGVLIDDAGHILTNHHVIAGAEELTVRLHDGREYEATVVGMDELTDLAVIRIESDDLPNDLPIAAFGNSDALRVGQFVLAIGSPFGLEQTVTSGVVSSKGRAVGITQYEDFVQTDTAINQGNSGGPLVNLRGEVVGINTAILSRTGGHQGIGLSISSNMASYVAESLVETGRVVRGYLGITMQPLTPDLAESFGYPGTDGIVVAEVTPDGPADAGGLMAGDILLAMDDERITEPRDLQMRVARLRPDQEVTFSVWREDSDQRVSVTIGEQPEDLFTAAGRQPRQEPRAPEAGTAQLGLQLGDLTADVRRRFQIPENVQGVAVVNVQPGSPAQEAGLQAGAVILDVVGQVPNNAAHAGRLIRQRAEEGLTVRLRVWTEGGVQFVALTPR